MHTHENPQKCIESDEQSMEINEQRWKAVSTNKKAMEFNKHQRASTPINANVWIAIHI
jgi:hypothetical protein